MEEFLNAGSLLHIIGSGIHGVRLTIHITGGCGVELNPKAEGQRTFYGDTATKKHVVSNDLHAHNVSSIYPDKRIGLNTRHYFLSHKSQRTSG